MWLIYVPHVWYCFASRSKCMEIAMLLTGLRNFNSDNSKWIYFNIDINNYKYKNTHRTSHTPCAFQCLAWVKGENVNTNITLIHQKIAESENGTKTVAASSCTSHNHAYAADDSINIKRYFQSIMIRLWHTHPHVNIECLAFLIIIFVRAYAHTPDVVPSKTKPQFTRQLSDNSTIFITSEEPSNYFSKYF